MFCNISSDGVALVVDACGFGCATGMGSMKTESGGAAGNGLDLALGTAGFEFAAGGGCIYTRSAEGGTSSGYLVSWAVAVVSKSMGFG